MDHSALYVIPFGSLSIGVHEFDWLIEKVFFAECETSEIEDACIKVHLTAVKHVYFMEVEFSMTGWAEVQCDRCLDPLKVDIETEVRMIVGFGNFSGKEEDDDDTDVVILSHDAHEMDMTHHLYEYIHLALPVRRVHQDDAAGKSACNEEMIKQLERYLVKERSGDN
ncbi:MAG: DUF177 domain-containing protein [Bacteroidales bacterium]|jgi:uncharacterized metal-binding protein YceD (DUF177 family)|nr:DUF177 domain-containing protein [Bacteroidales bacterium]